MSEIRVEYFYRCPECGGEQVFIRGSAGVVNCVLCGGEYDVDMIRVESREIVESSREELLEVIRECERKLLVYRTAFSMIGKKVGEQAGDEGLWFESESITEGYLQEELRSLHRLIEYCYERARESEFQEGE